MAACVVEYVDGQSLGALVGEAPVRLTEVRTWVSQPSTLSLYVGSPIQCPDPANVVRETQGVAVGQVEQTIDLSLNLYDGAWAMDETKDFWVGKDEGGFDSFRATDTVSIRRICVH